MEMNLTTLYDVAKDIADKYRSNLVQEGMKTTGRLYNFTYNISYNGRIFQLLFFLPPEWKYIEYGTRPHIIMFPNKMPNVGAILSWMQIKQVVPTTLGHAIAISKKLQRDGLNHPGTKALHPLQKALMSDDFVGRIAEAITIALNKEITKDMIEVFDGLDTITLEK